MSVNATSTDGPPVVLGALGGLGAWILGYVVVFLAAGTDIQDSVAQRLLETVGEEPATYKMVGWVFYNTHLVDIVAEVPILGSFAINTVGNEDGFSVAVYLIPVVTLFAVALVVGLYHGVDDPTSGFTTGLTLLPGYLVLTIVGLFLFRVSIGDATASPQLVEGILFTGIAYPVVFAGAGGLTAGLLS